MKYVMILLAYLVAAGIGIYALRFIPHYTPPKAPADRIEKKWNRGRAMYNHKCISCHNANPDLRGTMGPPLRGVSKELLRERLKNGKGNMPAFPKMDRFVEELEEYLR